MVEGDGQSANAVLWNADTEVCLFYAMKGFKPVGINKHFHMMAIHKKFSESIGQSITSAQLWEHLGTMYNLPVLDESQSLPFSNKVEEFKLPDEMMNFGKPPTEKTKVPVAETTPEPNIVKETQSSKSTTPAKSARKRTRTIPGQGGGAVGPGSNKRKRH